MKKLTYLLLFLMHPLFAQQTAEGFIYDGNSPNKKNPLSGANIYWTNSKVGTTTDGTGAFKISRITNNNLLIISYVGYKTDTITISESKTIAHWLQPTNTLDEVIINQRKKPTSNSYIKPINVINVSSDELLKAACCNLAESFETNPTIDVNFTDAISGTRQIKMLGLKSPYILITSENVPTIRGASQAYGLSFVPGTWIESLQITKGTGSVMNGFESIAGQINFEMKKPTLDDDLFVNAYYSVNGRIELNTHLNFELSDKWSTGFYLHGNLRNQKNDRNKDGFLDMPLAKQINILNRWQYTNLEKGFVSFINLRFLNDEKQGGEVDFNPERDKFGTEVWGSEIKTTRFDTSLKIGYVNPNIPYQSVGFQFAYSWHDQDSYFGLRNYQIEHKSTYSNLIYNSIISDSRHKIKTGISYTNDNYQEIVESENYKRTEESFGGFFEYNFDNLGALTMSAGLRLDYHNLIGTFITPRFHIRYAKWDKSAIRASFGRGVRTANIFAENQRFFGSSRAINIQSSQGKIYGLDPEIAWNYGISYLQSFNLFGKNAETNIDFYRTVFQNQVVVDWETPTEINFYNLNGDSYANSFQIEFGYSPFDRIDLKLAYKNYQVKTQYNDGKKVMPLIPQNRVFANVSYESKAKSKGQFWKFDTTFNWQSKQRFPSTALSPEAYQQPEYSPNLSLLNAQITRVFSPKFEIYLGGENITDVKQKNPIVSASDPFGSYFDTTFVYGPIFGSMYYIGLRYKLNKNYKK